MKKTQKNQLFAAIAMMIVAAIALGSVAYAWFTNVANPKVENIDVYVKAQNAMFLSARKQPKADDPTHWSTLITKADIANYQAKNATAYTWGNYNELGGGTLTGTNATNLFPAELTNASSVFNGTFHDFYIIDYDSEENPTGYSAIAPADLVTDGYAAKFDLWAMSYNSGFMYIDEKSLVESIQFAIDGLSFTKLEATNGPRYYVQDAIRVGFVPCTVNATTGARTENWAGAVIWEPHSNEHLPSGLGGPLQAGRLDTNAVKQVYSGTAATYPPAASNYEKQTTYGFITGDSTNVNASIPNSQNKIGLFNFTYDETTPAAQAFSVYIWVEGTDPDTKNVITDSTFLTNLVFGQEVGYNMDGTTTTP